MEQNMTVTMNAARPFFRLSGIVFAALLASVVSTSAVAGPVFSTHLDGAQEVSPTGSVASGTARFEFNDALTELAYDLHVFDIFDVTMAHIHVAPFGANGPVVLWLYPSAPPAIQIPGVFNGLLASGTITATNLVGTLSGQSLTSLHDAMVAGNTYVNVHSLVFPGGEVRGQIQAVAEPATLTILGLGLATLGVAFWRRTRRGTSLTTA